MTEATWMQPQCLVTAGPESQSVGGSLMGLKPSGAAQQTDWVHSLMPAQPGPLPDLGMPEPPGEVGVGDFKTRAQAAPPVTQISSVWGEAWASEF